MESASWAATGSGKAKSTELTWVIGELTRGREIAEQLLAMLRDDDDAASVLRTGSMVKKILDTFTGSLSIVKGTNSTYDLYSDEASQSQVSSYMINSPLATTKTEDSGESCKKPATKDRRGCYKRRRTSETWTKETPTSYDQDGHAWRKYGQKLILNAEHPRNYYRCTHKFDQLCQATKYVQKIQNEPSLYRITYHGRHTCKKSNESVISSHYDQLLMDAAATPNDSPVIWSFQSPQLGHDNNYKPATMMMKQHKTYDHKEVIYQTKSSITSHSHDDHRHKNDCFISAANPRFEISSVHNNNHLSAFSSAGSDHGDVISSDGYSCTTSAVHNNTLDISSLMDFEDFPEF